MKLRIIAALVLAILAMPVTAAAQFKTNVGGTGTTSPSGMLKGDGSFSLKTAIPGTDYVIPSALGSYLSLSVWYATTTDALDEGVTNLYWTPTRDVKFSTTSADFWKSQNNFFSTSSAAYYESTFNRWATSSAAFHLSTYDKGYFFSTTSVQFWETTQQRWATTSADYWQTQRNFFSTSSALYYSSLGLAFSTTSANAWSAAGLGFSTTSINFYAQSSTTLPKTYTANSFTAQQTFTNTSSTNATTSGNLYLPGLATPAGAVLAVDPTGKVQATTTSAGGVTAVSATYPVLSTGGSAPTISLAFGTSSPNTWGSTQTFTNAPVFSSLSVGTLNVGTGGTLYSQGTSTPSAGGPITYSGTFGTLIGGVSGSFGCTTASGSAAGCLSTTDWTSFNSRLSTTSIALLDKGFFFSTTSATYFTSAGLGHSTSSFAFNLGTYDKGYFFSTTSVQYWESTQSRWATTSSDFWLAQKDKGYFFSTTSADAWLNTKSLSAFSTTSADYWQSQRNFFSTTSALYFSSVGLAHSTSSVAAQLLASPSLGTTTAINLNVTGGSTSTYSGGISALRLNWTATSSASAGINLTGGCFAINDVCIGGGSGSQTPWTSTINGGGFALTNAGAITAVSVTATSTTATSSFNILSVGSTTPNGSDLFSVGTSSSLFEVRSTDGSVRVQNGRFVVSNLGRITAIDGTAVSFTATGFQLSANSSDVLIQNNVSSAASGVRLQTRPVAGGNLDPNSTINFYIGLVERFRVNGYGLVGISTTSPYAMLSIAGTSTGTTTMAIAPVAGQTASLIDFYNTSGRHSVITAAGNWGIGTTNPDALLSVNGIASTSQLAGAGLFDCQGVGNKITYNAATARFLCEADQNSGGSGFSTTSANFWASVGLGHSTSSFAYNLSTYDKGYFFSTTSTNYWESTQSRWATTSANYYTSAGLSFSTTSASYFLSQNTGAAFSTTSANYWETVQTARTADDLTNNSIEDLNDVASMTKSNGDLFGYNGTTWTNRATSTLFNIAANGVTGLLSGTDWATFNNKAPTASPTFTGTLTFANATGTNATTTSLAVGNLSQANCDVKSNGGVLYCGTDATGGGGGVWDWTISTNFNVTVNATGTPTHYLNGVFASSTSNFVDLTIFDNLAIGTTSPYAKFGILAVPDGVPFMSIATSSHAYGQLLNLIATSTGLVAVDGSVDPGVRLALGTPPSYYSDQFMLNGRINTGYWKKYECKPLMLAAQITAATTQACGEWFYRVDASGSLSTNITQSSYPSVLLALGALAAGNNGAGLFLGNTAGSAGAFNAGSSTPVVEFVGRIRTSTAIGTTTSFYIGFSNVNPAGTAYEVEPTVGCYFVASSTRPNWAALCRTSISQVTLVDTGIASTTDSTPTVDGDYYKMRVEMDSRGARFWMETPAISYRQVANISTNYTATTSLNASAHISIGSGGTQTPAFYIDSLTAWIKTGLFNR